MPARLLPTRSPCCPEDCSRLLPRHPPPPLILEPDMPARSRPLANRRYLRLRHVLAAACLPLLLAACDDNRQAFYQGYVEGEFVYMAPERPGRLQALHVARGDEVAAGAPLFSLDATPEAQARREARAGRRRSRPRRGAVQARSRPIRGRRHRASPAR